MKTLHTATPWAMDDFGENAPYRIYHIEGGLNAQIAYVDGVTQHGDIAKANAAYIVKCVNSHEQLIEALRKLSTTSETMSEYSNHFMKNSIKLDYQTALSEAKRLLEEVSND